MLDRFKLMVSRFDFFALLFLLLCGLFFRFIHFDQRLHFTGDQAEFSLRSFEIWQNKELTLVGVPSSWNYQGLRPRFGSTTYYFLLIALLPSNFDPRNASMIMGLIAILMIIPIYFGVKKFLNKDIALLIAGIYALFPTIIDYTIFLWNPNIQLLLAPLAIFFIGQDQQKHHKYNIGLIGFMMGLIMTFNFQFIFVAATVMLFYLYEIYKRKTYFELLWLIGGGMLGFSPVILSELRTQFFTTRTFLLIFAHWKEVRSGSGGNPIHYFMITFLFALLPLSWLLRKRLTLPIVSTILLGLIVWCSFLYVPAPKNAWNQPEGWYYKDELTVHNLITSQNSTNFNIMNLAYVDPLAQVQKYLLATKAPDLYSQLSDDYYNNKNLFIVTRKEEDLTKSINYEVNTFVPTTTQSWDINERYTLHLWER